MSLTGQLAALLGVEAVSDQLCCTLNFFPGDSAVSSFEEIEEKVRDNRIHKHEELYLQVGDDQHVVIQYSAVTDGFHIKYSTSYNRDHLNMISFTWSVRPVVLPSWLNTGPLRA